MSPGISLPFTGIFSSLPFFCVSPLPLYFYLCLQPHYVDIRSFVILYDRGFRSSSVIYLRGSLRGFIWLGQPWNGTLKNEDLDTFVLKDNKIRWFKPVEQCSYNFSIMFTSKCWLGSRSVMTCVKDCFSNKHMLWFSVTSFQGSHKTKQKQNMS